MGQHLVRTSYRYGREGIALVTSLIVLVLVGALAAGAFFLAQTNLRMAENQRSQVVAKANANSGLDLAIAEATRLYALPDGYPVSISVPSVAEANVTFDVVYTPSVDLRSAEVVAIGYGPRGATHTAQALLGQGITTRWVPLGALVALDVVDVRGMGSARIIDGGVFANNGFKMTGADLDQFLVCLERNPGGVCTSWAAYENVEGTPVGAWAGSTGYTCDPAVFCDDDGVPINTFDQRITLDLTYSIAMETVLRRAGVPSPNVDVVESGAYLGSYCGVGLVVCLSGAEPITVTAAEAALWPPGTTVIADGDLRLDGASGGFFRDVNFISNGTISVINTPNLEDVQLLSRETPNFGVSQAGPGAPVSSHLGDLLGETTIATRGSITVAGASARLPTTDPPTVGLVFVADGAVTFLGAGAVALQGNIWAGGNVTLSGAGGFVLYGSITSGGNIEIKGGGNLTVDAGLRSTNTILIGRSGVGLASIRR